MTTSTSINIGLNPNDGSGDTIRDAFIKTNTYFSYLSQVLSTLTNVEVNLKLINLLDTPQNYTTGTSQYTSGPIILAVNNSGTAYVNKLLTGSPDITVDPPSPNDGNINIRLTYPANIDDTANFPNTTVVRDSNGDIFAGNLATSSDIKLKTVTGNVTNALDKIESINGVNFYWNETAQSKGLVDKKLQVGVLAQEIQKVMPEAVLETNGSLYVKYDQLIPLLIEAVKELNKKIDSKFGKN
jgi:hypothetical protein